MRAAKEEEERGESDVGDGGRGRRRGRRRRRRKKEGAAVRVGERDSGFGSERERERISEIFEKKSRGKFISVQSATFRRGEHQTSPRRIVFHNGTNRPVVHFRRGTVYH